MKNQEQDEINIGKSDNENSSTDSGEHVNHAICVNKTKTKDYIIDSGATLHTSKNIALVANSTEWEKLASRTFTLSRAEPSCSEINDLNRKEIPIIKCH